MTAPGDLITGRYRLTSQVASGGMGSVWKAWDQLLQRAVAVKLLLERPGLDDADADAARNRVIREARITARLHHPHAVTLFDVVDHEGRPCLIMEFVPAKTLSSIMKTEGPLELEVAARIGGEVADALAAAHRFGVVHRDVKPGNILITEDGSTKITDFGISHAIGDVSLTPSGMVAGTPAYFAPEVARGDASSFPADVYSLGATLYAAVEGQPPFGTDGNPIVLLHRVATGRVSPPERGGPLTPLLLRMLAAESRDRPTMAEVRDALTGAAFAALPPAVEPEPEPELEPVRQPASQPASQIAPPLAPVLVPASVPLPASVPPADEPPAHDRASIVGAHRAVPDVRAPTDEDEPELVAAEPARANRSRRGVLIGIAAAVAVALLLGGTLWLAVPGNDEGESGTAQPGSSVAAAPATPSAEVTPPTSAATAGSPGTTTQPAAPAPPAASTPSPTADSSVGGSATAETDPTTASVVDSPPATPQPAAAPAPTEPAAFVTDYYALLPADTDTGWERLTERFRSEIAQDREYYESFWGGVNRVEIADAVATAEDGVEATVTYYFADGQVTTERTAYELVLVGDSWNIDYSTVLTSQDL